MISFNLYSFITMKDKKLIDIFEKQGLFNNENLETLQDVFELIWGLLAKKEELEPVTDGNDRVNDFISYIKKKYNVSLKEWKSFYENIFSVETNEMIIIRGYVNNIYSDFLQLFFVRFDENITSKYPELEEIFSWLRDKYPKNKTDIVYTDLYNSYRLIARYCHPCKVCKYDATSWETRHWFCPHN